MKTRKQIIELIKPYMDKTEYRNFLFRDNKGNIREMNQYMFISGNEVYIERAGYDKPRLFCNIKEIIGHYDITAVLKYIVSKGYEYRDNGYSNIKIHNGYELQTTLLNLPYKPLHLYTEQEDKDLLELLQRIGK